MKKILDRTLTIACSAVLLWLIASYLDIVINNLNGANFQPWNALILFLNMGGCL